MVEKLSSMAPRGPLDPHLTSNQARVLRVRHVEQVAGTVAEPVFFSVLVILLVYVPILSLTGVDGKMFRPMAMTVVFALPTSLVLSLTFVPAAAATLPRSARHSEARSAARPADREALPPASPDRARRALGSSRRSVALLGVGGVFFARAGSEFVPQLDEGDLVVQTTRAAGHVTRDRGDRGRDARSGADEGVSRRSRRSSRASAARPSPRTSWGSSRRTCSCCSGRARRWRPGVEKSQFDRRARARRHAR